MGTIEANELQLFIDNDGDLYRQQTTSILKNLMTKRARGQYKHDLAVKAFGYLVESGAKKYAREFGSPGLPWHKMFDVPTRKHVAEELTREFETDASLGNYDGLLPKKYQPPSHARRKSHQELHTPGALRSASDRQVVRFYRNEKHDAARAGAEAERRGITLHARKRPAQLDRDIAAHVPSWRGGRI